MRAEGRREGPGARGNGPAFGGPRGMTVIVPSAQPPESRPASPVGQSPTRCWLVTAVAAQLSPASWRGARLCGDNKHPCSQTELQQPGRGWPRDPTLPRGSRGSWRPTGQPRDTSLPSSPPRQLKHDFPRALIFSTDDYFFREDGAYEFNPDFLEEAHEWNQERGDTALSGLAGCPIVYVDR